jgi:hypothetical protein
MDKMALRTPQVSLFDGELLIGVDGVNKARCQLI